MRVRVYEPLVARLLAGPRPYVGTLVGYVEPDVEPVFHVLNCLLDQVEGGQPGVGSQLLASLPAGLSPLGLAASSQQQAMEAGLITGLVSLLPRQAAGTAVVLAAPDSGTQLCCHLYTDGELVPTEYTQLSVEQLKASTLLLRVDGALRISCLQQQRHLDTAFDTLAETVRSPAACFLQPESGRLLRATRETSDSSARETCSLLAPRAAKNQKKTQQDEQTPVVFRLLIQTTGLTEQRPVATAPVIQYDRSVAEERLIQLQLPADSLALVPRSAPLSDLGPLLAESLRRLIMQLRAVVQQTFREGGQLAGAADIYHFLPEPCGHFITLVYSAGSSEERLESYRRNVHAALLLPADRPLFRRANSHSFESRDPYLRNVHRGLTPPSASAQLALVSGSYAYHHYMQDRMDDNGWGCAYRSLQTVVSWFRFQGYADRAVPSHAEIQQCLVDLGDKPASFVGSKQWIGSTEVSYCLNRLLQVESKILHVSSGAELASKGRDLVHHFTTEGTPVMIGGGVLAHTILGVCFDSATGDTWFLILDPHYTGGEDLTVIQGKGWCGWKDAQFWDPSAYYNMCLPLRPRDCI